jgi:hypothetical protein
MEKKNDAIKEKVYIKDAQKKVKKYLPYWHIRSDQVAHNKECYAEVAPVEGGASEEDGMFPP